jgi:hypothetical protein
LEKNQGGDGDSTNSENDSFLKKSVKDDKKIKDTESKKTKSARAKTCINIKTTIQIGAFFAFLFLCFLIIIIIFNQNLDEISNYSELYKITSSESIEYQSIFDILREYFYDKNSYTGNISYEKKLNEKLVNVYEFQKTQETAFSFDKLPSKFKSKYLSIKLNDLCPYAKNLFQDNNTHSHIKANNYTCENLTENNGQYGLNLLISYYLEQIRIQKNFFETMVVQNSDPLDIFNKEHLFQLSMIRRYFLLPIYNDTLNDFYRNINSFWNTSYDIFFAVMIIIIIILTSFYLAYWIPVIISIDEDIYKTKNMLSIIPKDVLSTIPGINKLLNLGNITVFSGDWNNQNDKKNKDSKKEID